MDEKDLNNLQKEDISETYNDVFAQNTTTEAAESEMMNRDYLHRVYGGEVNALNKVVLLTRTQHLKRIEDIKATYEKEYKEDKIRLIISSVILCICVVSAISFYAQGLHYYALFAENIIDVGISGGYTVSELKAMWQIFGLSGMMGSVFLLVGGLQFFFLGYGNIKHIKKLKRNEEKALQHLEDIKKENMLTGTYDSSK